MILLTGATGCLGSSLLKQLLSEGYEVCCLKRKTSDCSRVAEIMQNDRCRWYDLEEGQIRRIFEENMIDLVIHCATNYGRKDAEYFQVYRTNLFLPLELLEYAAAFGCRYFINTDTFFVKQVEHLWKDDSPLYLDPYVKTKYLFTHITNDRIGELDMAFFNLRLEHVYGGDEGEGKFAGFLLHALLSGRRQIELTEGKQIRDWVYIQDVVSAYLTVIRYLSRFSIGHMYQFEVGTGIGRSLKDFVETAKRITNSQTNLLFGKKGMHKKELLYSCADNAALRELGWQPYYQIEDGIRAAVEDLSKRTGQQAGRFR